MIVTGGAGRGSIGLIARKSSLRCSRGRVSPRTVGRVRTGAGGERSGRGRLLIDRRRRWHFDPPMSAMLSRPDIDADWQAKRLLYQVRFGSTRRKPAGRRSEKQIFNAQGAGTDLALFGRYWRRYQSNLIPAFFATPAHLRISDLMYSAKSSGVVPTGSTPCASWRSRNSGT